MIVSRTGADELYSGGEKSMLIELSNPRQIPGEGRRRWFMDDYFDLIVWYADDGTLTGFQLCYDKRVKERALTWTRDGGYRHNRIDDGETPGHPKMSPVIVADGTFDRAPVAERFRAASAGIDPAVASFVYDTVLRHP
jgi:hypothetical protein